MSNDVTINTYFNGVTDGVHVPIFMDGNPTSYTTPHTFTGLSSIHTFAVPYKDSAGHPFRLWSANVQSDPRFTTITVNSSDTYTAIYDTQLNTSRLTDAQMIFFITPNDTAVVQAAAGKSWQQIVDYVSTLHGTPIQQYQFPNQTIQYGTTFFPDYATLCCSMLRARGYSAYLAGSLTPHTPAHWVVIDFNGAFTFVDPRYSYSQQQTVDFSSYHAGYLIDENGIYQTSLEATPNPTPTPTSTTTPTIPEFPPTITAAVMALVLVAIAGVCCKKKKALIT